MAESPQISDAEWQVMNVVWEDQPLSSQEVVSALTHQTNWSPPTIKTMLHRLVKKEVLVFEQEGNHYLYRSKLRRSDCIRRAGRSFLHRVFSGETAPMLVHFVKSEQLSSEDIQQLKKLLEEKEAKS